jgi:hypothetical protein
MATEKLRILIGCLFLSAFFGFSQQDTLPTKISFENGKGEKSDMDSMKAVVEFPNLLKLDPVAIFISGEIVLCYERMFTPRFGMEFGAGPTVIFWAQPNISGISEYYEYKTGPGYCGRAAVRIYVFSQHKFSSGFRSFFVSAGIRTRTFNFMQVSDSYDGLEPFACRTISNDAMINIGMTRELGRRTSIEVYLGCGLKYFKTNYGEPYYVPVTGISWYPSEVEGTGSIFGLGFKLEYGF